MIFVSVWVWGIVVIYMLWFEANKAILAEHYLQFLYWNFFCPVALKIVQDPVMALWQHIRCAVLLLECSSHDSHELLLIVEILLDLAL